MHLNAEGWGCGTRTLIIAIPAVPPTAGLSYFVDVCFRHGSQGSE